MLLNHYLTARCLFAVVSLTGLMSISGCASTLELPWANHTPKASAKNPVMQIVCMWEPSEGRDPNGMPCRGFAGQVLFLGNKGGTPVAVDGEVMVYVFDDHGSPEEQTKPVHQFRFDKGAWNRHMRVGSLGPAYHCFIPYTRPGNLEANCTLRLKLTPEEGATPLTSEGSNIALRGKARRLSEADQQYAHLPRQAYQTSRPDEGRSSRTTTIPLDQRGQPSKGYAEQGRYDDSGVVPASYATEHETQEQRMQRILDEHRQTQAALQQATQQPAVAKASPRLKLAANTLATETATNGPMNLAADQDVYYGLHPLTANTSHPADPARRHPLMEDDTVADHAPQARSQAPWVPESIRNAPPSDDTSAELDWQAQTTNVQ